MTPQQRMGREGEAAAHLDDDDVAAPHGDRHARRARDRRDDDRERAGAVQALDEGALRRGGALVHEAHPRAQAHRERRAVADARLGERCLERLVRPGAAAPGPEERGRAVCRCKGHEVDGGQLRLAARGDEDEAAQGLRLRAGRGGDELRAGRVDGPRHGHEARGGVRDVEALQPQLDRHRPDLRVGRAGRGGVGRRHARETHGASGPPARTCGWNANVDDGPAPSHSARSRALATHMLSATMRRWRFAAAPSPSAAAAAAAAATSCAMRRMRLQTTSYVAPPPCAALSSPMDSRSSAMKSAVSVMARRFFQRRESASHCRGVAMTMCARSKSCTKGGQGLVGAQHYQTRLTLRTHLEIRRQLPRQLHDGLAKPATKARLPLLVPQASTVL